MRHLVHSQVHQGIIRLHDIHRVDKWGDTACFHLDQVDHVIPDVLRFNTQWLIHIPEAFTQKGILCVGKTHSMYNLTIHLQVCETKMTHRAHFLFLFQHLKYSQMEHYVHWHLHGRCTKQSIQLFHNYRITFVTMWMFTPRVYLEKHHLKKKKTYTKNFWVFHWINSHKKWVTKSIRKGT